MSGEFDILRSAAAGMDAQRAALDVAARNVAAAETDGPVFERLVPRYAYAAPAGDEAGSDAEGFPEPGDPGAGLGEGSSDDAPIRYLGASVERGVEVDAVTEMVSVLDAQRAYEANASVFDIGKRLAERTIDLGRLE